MSVADTAADIELPMERPLFVPAVKPRIADTDLEAGDAEVDADALFSQVVVDKAELAGYVRQALQGRAQVTLQELCNLRPLRHGLAELVAYLQLAGDTFSTVVDESATDSVSWTVQTPDAGTLVRQARLPRVIFVR